LSHISYRSMDFGYISTLSLMYSRSVPTGSCKLALLWMIPGRVPMSDVQFLCPRRVAYSDRLIRPFRWGEVQCTNHNSNFHTFGVIALCSFSFLNFVWSITQKVFKLLTWNLRSHRVEMQCIRTITLGIILLELLNLNHQ